MSQAGTTRQRSRGRRIRIIAIAVVVAFVAFVSLVVLKPAMPDRILLLTGPEGSAYHDLGLRYVAELEKRGLSAEVVVTAGGLDNIERLAAGGEDTVAFAPAAIEFEAGADVDRSRLVSLGTVGFEPLWIFYRSELEIESIRDLANHVVVTGGQGTVSDYLARQLLEQNGITGGVEFQSAEERSGKSAIDRIDAGDVDALFVTGAPQSTVVGTLLDDRNVSFLFLDRAEAYAARIQGLTSVVVPEGLLDLARNIPPEKTRLLSASTALVSLDSLHPGVVPVVLDAASSVHDEKTLLSTTTTFPNRENTSLPLDKAAGRYFDQGERGLSKFLPYQVTRFLNHLGFVVLPLLTAAVVLLKLVPAALRIYGSARLVGLLKRLEAVEKGQAAGLDRATLLADLDRADEKSAKMFVPRSTVHDYIDVRQFLHDMRERVERGDDDRG